MDIIEIIELNGNMKATSITPFGIFYYECSFDEHDNVCDQINAELKGWTDFNKLRKDTPNEQRP